MSTAEDLIPELLNRGYHINLFQHIREYRLQSANVYVDFHSQILLRLAHSHVEYMAEFGISKSDRVKITKDGVTSYSNPDHFIAWTTSGCPGTSLDALNYILANNKPVLTIKANAKIEYTDVNLIPELIAARKFLKHGGAKLLLDLIESEEAKWNPSRLKYLDNYSVNLLKKTKMYLQYLSRNHPTLSDNDFNDPFYDAWILSRAPGISIDKMFDTWNLLEF